MNMQTQVVENVIEGQRVIVLPKSVQEYCAATPGLQDLYVTDIGHYPRAAVHDCHRQAGTSEHILIHCVNGQGWVTLPSGHFEIKPNEFLVIPAGMRHHYGSDDNNPWSIYWVHFTGKHASHLVPRLSEHGQRFVHPLPYNEERTRLFNSTYRALEDGYCTNNLTYSGMAASYYLASFAFSDKFEPVLTETHGDAIEESIQFMERNLNKLLTIGSLSAMVNLSPSHYAAIFRKKTGFPPIVYFNNLKVQYACQFLQGSSLRINEIAIRLGFEDPYYFSRLFTRVMGLPPTAYRDRTTQ